MDGRRAAPRLSGAGPQAGHRRQRGGNRALDLSPLYRLGSVRLLKEELEAHGINSKSWKSAAGRVIGGKPFSRGALYLILHMWTAPSLQGVLQCFDQIACVHMSGLFVRSHMNTGQDGFRGKSSKQNRDLIEGHWKMRNVSRRGSIDHTFCSLSCKFWHQLSTVAVELLTVSG
jgi:hypothetical protein